MVWAPRTFYIVASPKVTMLALRIAYDGSLFHGSQRQPHGQTVEDTLISRLCAVDAANHASPPALRLVSRTDRGVSARESFAFLALDKDILLAHNRLERMNAMDGGLWITGLGEGTYSPPYHKEYRYFLPPDVCRGERLEEACALFSGTHDFASFSRHNPEKTTIRTVSLSLDDSTGHPALVFGGTGFLWQMCRRIAYACIGIARGNLQIEQIASLLTHPTKRKIPAAPADFLLLTRVDVPFQCTDLLSGLTAMATYYTAAFERQAALSALSKYLL